MGWKNRIRQARNRLDNVDDEISSLLNQIRVEQDEEVILKKSKNLSSLEKQAIFDLFEKNMMDLYQQCGWDCSYESKRKELFDKNSIFVLVRTFGSSIKGYGMFRFEEDDEEYPEFPVIYLYELQVDVLYRSKGVASRVRIYIKIKKNHLDICPFLHQFLCRSLTFFVGLIQ